MFHYVYFLNNLNSDSYIGCTNNLSNRLERHNKGYVLATKSKRPWKLITYFAFNNEKVAFKFEKYLKTGSRREFVKRHLLLYTYPMKTLVVFYSKTGHSKQIAQLIASRLKADLDEIIDLKDRSGIKGWLLGGHDAMKEILTQIETSKNPSDYDLVIVGTPVWAGNSTPAVRTYVTQFKNKIKKFALFTTSGGATPEKTVAFLEKELGQKSIASTGWTDLEIKNNTVSVKLDQFLQEIK